MGYNLPFDPHSPSDVSRYASVMRSHLQVARQDPLRTGLTFTVRLAAPELPDTDDDRRELPPQSVFEETVWVLQASLQTGPCYSSQVWLARPQNTAITFTVVKFKFVVPSRLQIPDPDTAAFRQYWTSEEIVKNQFLAYQKLITFQGKEIPYCYGQHEVEMPWMRWHI
ncbi:hypothetical protein E1B28_004812 [Marasmius oreades]|uniref:Uncharacterized protein n=1 Tax=Marasmius oreades TaxID=181124 RepID=A0A9P8ADD2_9AGAR|nr:uncharacterized protein E1B28_004812 [Marasmius oreades]KAG7097469.1 hypothetical protein E1B28_004812 [Marasmius oreades]